MVLLGQLCASLCGFITEHAGQTQNERHNLHYLLDIKDRYEGIALSDMVDQFHNAAQCNISRSAVLIW